MNDAQHPIQSTASLLKALGISLLLAIALFLTTVLPAEFGIDPTGIGRVLGLNNLAGTEAETEPVTRAGTGDLAFRQDEVEIIVPANGGLEYKFFLAQHATLTYDWTSTAELYFDMHGEPDGDTTGYFESYGAGTVSAMKGTTTTPFAGSHGWYWRNSTDEDATVSLTTLGNYEVIGLK